VRFESTNILFYFEERSSLLQRWRCSCKFKSRRIGSSSRLITKHTQESILRLSNLQLQRCGGLACFSKQGKYFYSRNTLAYSLLCKFLQHWRCNSRSLDWLQQSYFLDKYFNRLIGRKNALAYVLQRWCCNCKCKSNWIGSILSFVPWVDFHRIFHRLSKVNDFLKQILQKIWLQIRNFVPVYDILYYVHRYILYKSLLIPTQGSML
jgi:hypothetical protein